MVHFFIWIPSSAFCLVHDGYVSILSPDSFRSSDNKQVMIEAVENHMPQTIIIDEIGTELEALAASTIAQRGVQLVATAHGVTIESIIKNPSLQILVGGIEVQWSVFALRIFIHLYAFMCVYDIDVKPFSFV